MLKCESLRSIEGESVINHDIEKTQEWGGQTYKRIKQDVVIGRSKQMKNQWWLTQPAREQVREVGKEWEREKRRGGEERGESVDKPRGNQMMGDENLSFHPLVSYHQQIGWI